MEPHRFTDAILLMLVLFNPLLMSTYLHEVMRSLPWRDFLDVLVRAFLISGCVFVLFAWAGDSLFAQVLQVRFAAFLIFGGIVFLIIAVRYLVVGAEMIGQLRGPADQLTSTIAMPFMIGPGTISASVVIGSRLPLGAAVLAISIALLVSCLLLLWIKWLFDVLQQRMERLVERYLEIAGRVAALIIGTIAIEMILRGLDLWVAGRA